MPQRFMESIMKEFLEVRGKPKKEESNEATRKFQLLIYKIFNNLEVLEPTFDTERVIIHSLEMLSKILDQNFVMKCSEIAYMFYTKHSTEILFSLIIRDYNYMQ